MKKADLGNFDFKYTERIVIYKGFRIHTYAFGHGKNTVLALPSFPFSGLYYLWFLNYYDLEKVRFLTFDIPGWAGNSTNIFAKKKFSLKEVVKIAIYVLKMYDVKKFSLLGYSFGGAIALKIFAEVPKQVRSIVLVSAVVKGSFIRSRTLLKLALWIEKLNLQIITRWVFINRMSNVFLTLQNKGVSPSYISEYKLLLQHLSAKTMTEGLQALVANECDYELDLVNGMKTPITVINSRNELPLFRRQARYIRSRLNHESSMYLSGDHNDFIVNPTSEVVKKVVKYLG